VVSNRHAATSAGSLPQYADQVTGAHQGGMRSDVVCVQPDLNTEAEERLGGVG
jgi:hypothetical protein